MTLIGLMLCVGALIYAVWAMMRTKSCSQPETKSTIHPKNEDDDFADNSIGAFFLLEEIVDDPLKIASMGDEIVFDEDDLFYDIEGDFEFYE